MTTPEPADETAVARIRAAVDGDPKAFETLVAHYAARLRWLIRLRLDPALHARVSADDILQETLLVASRRIGDLVIDSEPAFWTWLCRVCEQRLVDARRHHLAHKRDARRERSPGPPAMPAVRNRLEHVHAANISSPSSPLRTAEQRDALAGLLEELPESFREVIVLRIVEGLGVADTASIMGRSPGAIRVLLSKAVRRLADLVARDASGTGGAAEDPS